MVHRTRGDRGNLQLDIRLPGFGRFRLSAGTKRARIAKHREALARQLDENGQLDTLAALKDGSIRWSVIERAHKQQRLNDAALLSDLRVNAPLWPAIRGMVFSKNATTQRWYVTALGYLRAVGFGDAARVADLATDWPERLASWSVRPATKNALRRAVSRFLSKYLGTKLHPFRVAVIHPETWPYARVAKRFRGVSAAEFWALMARVPERGVPSYVTLAASGMRVGEYLNDAAMEMDAARHLIYPDGKTGPKAYAVAPELWPYVQQAIPCRVSSMKRRPARLQNDPRYKRLYLWLRRAGKALGVTVTLHDLRRLYVRLGVARMGETATQTAVGHETAMLTRDYARWDTRAVVAQAVGDALMSGEMSGKVTTGRAGTRRAKSGRTKAKAG